MSNFYVLKSEVLQYIQFCWLPSNDYWYFMPVNTILGQQVSNWAKDLVLYM